MPFDFYEMSPYTIDYNDLKKELLLLPQLLSDCVLHQKYINKWVSTLQHHDKIVVGQMNTPEKLEKYLRRNQQEPEFFQVPVYLGKNTFQLHFCIASLIQILKKYSYVKPIDIALSDITKSDSVQFTKQNSLGNRSIDEPIILAPFPIGSRSWLVIDGNHRLSEHIKRNSATISAFSLNGAFLTCNQLLASSYDQFLYAMFLELRHTFELSREGKNDAFIWSQSFLQTQDNFHMEHSDQTDSDQTDLHF